MEAYKKNNRVYIITSIHTVFVVNDKQVKELFMSNTDDFIDNLINRGYEQIQTVEID